MTTTTAASATSLVPSLRLAALRLLLVAGALGLGANLLFVNQPLGLNFPLFMIVLLTALGTLAALERVRAAWRNAWLAVPLVYFAAMTAVRAEVFVTVLNVCAALGLAVLLIYLFSSGRLTSFSVWDYVMAAMFTGVEAGLVQPGLVLVAAGNEAARPGGASRQGLAILRGLAISAPILILLTVLLTAADAAFNQWVLDALKFLSLDDIPELLLRVLVTGAVGWMCAGGLAYALRDTPVAQSVETRGERGWRLGFTEAAMVLFSVNALFAAFVAVQFRYFFGGQSNITVAGFTYAEYARRGFAELVLVALFTLGLGLALQSVTRRQTSVTVVGFNALCTLLVILTGIILASAFQRLLLYEEAYGFTRLRTYPHVFMAWVGVLLGAFLITTLLNRPRLFVFSLFLAALGFVATLDILNTDAFIARQNIARFQSTGKLDATYLATLSDDAIREILPLLNSPDEEVRTIIGGAWHYRLNELESTSPGEASPGWHWARSQAYALLAQHRAELERYEPEQYYWRVPID
jgi:hypothetical protein